MCEGKPPTQEVPPPAPPPPPSVAPQSPTPLPNGAPLGSTERPILPGEDPLPLGYWLFGPKPKRSTIISYALIWGFIAPAVNLWGSGSFILSLLPGLSRDKKLDTFYPVSDLPRYPYTNGYLDYAPGFKRYVDDSDRFEFRYPATYIRDSAVFLKNADAGYTRRVLQGPTLANTPVKNSRRRAASGTEVAFGREGRLSEENLSVVTGELVPGFTLRGTLGPPAEAAERLIQTSIAKAGVREVTLLSARERVSQGSGQLLYQFEYRVDYPGLEATKEPSFTVCVVGAVGDTLYTFASRVPLSTWEMRADDLRQAASSFVLYK